MGLSNLPTEIPERTSPRGVISPSPNQAPRGGVPRTGLRVPDPRQRPSLPAPRSRVARAQVPPGTPTGSKWGSGEVRFPGACPGGIRIRARTLPTLGDYLVGRGCDAHLRRGHSAGSLPRGGLPLDPVTEPRGGYFDRPRCSDTPLVLGNLGNLTSEHEAPTTRQPRPGQPQLADSDPVQRGVLARQAMQLGGAEVWPPGSKVGAFACSERGRCSRDRGRSPREHSAAIRATGRRRQPCR